MNSSGPMDQFYEMFTKNFLSITLGLIINYVNGTFVIVFLKNSIFYSDSRYILYIHLVVNDMLMLSLSVCLQLITYFWRVSVSFCCVLLCLSITVTCNSPLILACMAIERYIAICKPLHHTQLCTVRRTYMIIFLIWTTAVTPALGDIFITLSIRRESFFSTAVICHGLFVYNTWVHTVKDTVVNVVYLSLVWITLVVTYFKVLLAANAASADGSARKARNTILLHGAQVLLCMTSYVTPFLSTALIEIFPQRRTNILYGMFLWSNVLPRLLSPLIYGLRDKQLVERVKVYFCCKPVKSTHAISMK